MLEFESVSFRNFMSYGDYLTTVPLSGVGQCLIRGEVVAEDNEYDSDNFADKSGGRSNGAGKSGIPNVILWVLFGRTMYSANPGDKVVNWFTGGDCWAQLKFKNGDQITRTRTAGGDSELIFTKNGDERRSIANSLATLKTQQAELSRIFQLDWELLCGSAFFTQYSKPWLEMADQVRKKAIERALHVDRFNNYSNIAKLKCDNVQLAIGKLNAKVSGMHDNIQTLEQSIAELQNSLANFEQNKLDRKAALLDRITTEEHNRDALQLPDLKQLQEKWAVVDQINTKLFGHSKEISGISDSIDSLNRKIRDIDIFVKGWRAKAGKVCVECEQDIATSTTEAKIAPRLAEREQHTAAIAELATKKGEIEALVAKVKALLQDRKPKQSLDDARALHARFKRHNDEIARLRRSILDVEAEQNPHVMAAEQLTARIDALRTEITKHESEIGRLKKLYDHYYYIQRAYSERTKIKSYVFEKRIPAINNRLRHYMDVFGLDIRVELTPSLGVSSNLWGYDFQSGGERKRTDVAFMLAMFDLHEDLYGRQCNVLVLDEVDGRMDDDGIDGLINIIRNDLSHRVETIFVISHRNLMQNVFPRELHVKRRDRLSMLV